MSAYLNGGKAILSGTSMASPHVAGIAAKVMGESTRTLERSLHLKMSKMKW